MEPIVGRINNSLSALFNKADAVYKALVADIEGVPEAEIIVPNNYRIGAVANLLQYLIDTAWGYSRQIYADKAGDKVLKYFLEDFFGIIKIRDESNEDWLNRTIAITFSPIVSEATIKNILKDYTKNGSPDEVKIIAGTKMGTFALFVNHSFLEPTQIASELLTFRLNDGDEAIIDLKAYEIADEVLILKPTQLVVNSEDEEEKKRLLQCILSYSYDYESKQAQQWKWRENGLYATPAFVKSIDSSTFLFQIILYVGEEDLNNTTRNTIENLVEKYVAAGLTPVITFIVKEN